MAQPGHSGSLEARLTWSSGQAGFQPWGYRREEVVRVRSDTTATGADRAPRGARQASAPAGPRYRAVHDRVALDEIGLFAELIIAAERSDEPLSREDIDRILGLTVQA